jgi:hypothetical protein
VVLFRHLFFSTPKNRFKEQVIVFCSPILKKQGGVMGSRLKAIWIFAVFLSVSATQLAEANWLDQDRLLSASDRTSIYAGRQVTKRWSAGDRSPWDGIRIYQLVSATPSEVMGYFYDHRTHRLLNDDLKKVEIRRGEGSTSFDLFYELSLTLWLTEEYIVRNTLIQYKGDRNNVGYQMKWKDTWAKRSDLIEGFILVEPHGNETLIVYDNLIHPGSISIGEGRGVAAAEGLVGALKNNVLNQKRNHPDALAARERVMKRAVGSRFSSRPRP